MAYYEDLTEYRYHNGAFHRPGTMNIGWLAPGHEFDVADASEELLDKLWRFCSVSVAQMRGIHPCELCSVDESYYVERNGQHLLLGSSEIRVFARDESIYAAPTLIYHYVFAHRYAPPAEFVRALDEGPAPPDAAYFGRLAAVGLEWNKTSAPEHLPDRFKHVRVTKDGVTTVVKVKV